MDDHENKTQLLHELKVAKGSKFNAAERLQRRDRNRTYITSAATITVIMLTVLPLTFHIPTEYISALNFLTIAMSIIILVYSLLQYSNGDLVAADQHHRCALEINALRRKLRNLKPDETSIFAEISDAYDDLLSKYNLNHAPVDFERYKLEHPSEFNESDEDKKRDRKNIKSESKIESLVETFVNTVMGIVVLGAVLLTIFSPKGMLYRLIQNSLPASLDLKYMPQRPDYPPRKSQTEPK